ncbi:hypothetical protein ACIQFP_06905 [Nocardiopsis alba]|uniref:hypothetical protein n=1 Tax=Nocardiopsis alba TaxID=53437 RepID=UPI0038007E04
MSYDTVALVAQEPGLETVARTLERTVPGLWVRAHPGTGLLELRSNDRRRIRLRFMQARAFQMAS